MSEGTATCAACGNPAPVDVFRCSKLGAATFNYCHACAYLGAESAEAVKDLIGEPEQVAEWLVVYDKETDWYRYYRDDVALEPAQDKDGNQYRTRAELNPFLAAHWKGHGERQ